MTSGMVYGILMGASNTISETMTYAQHTENNVPGTSLFCSSTGEFGLEQSTSTQCLKAPSQCVAFYEPLEMKSPDVLSVAMPSDTCFRGFDVSQPTDQREPNLFCVPGGQRAPKISFLFMSAAMFFSSSQDAFEKPQFNRGEQPRMTCVSNANLTNALSTINKPVTTYQMAAYMAPLAVTTDPAVIAGISLLVASNFDIETQGLTLYNGTPGLYTGPSDMSFQLLGMPNFEFYVPGIAEPDSADAATVQKKFMFKQGVYKGTTVLNADCGKLNNIPIVKVFRKLGVNDAAKTKVIQPGMYFNIEACMTTLNMCEDIQKLETKCTECNATQIQRKPCSMYADTLCEHVSTISPASKSAFKLKENTANEVVVVAVGAFVVVFIAIIAAQTIHQKRKRLESSVHTDQEPGVKHGYKKPSSPYGSI